jgi:cyclophilin family peptidyl-prolyl cis-trans isomerase
MRRLASAARLYAERGSPTTTVIVSGGRRWGSAIEADVMAGHLARAGVPSGRIVRERCSLSTRDNARFTAAALARRGTSRAALVTCEWHLPRAALHFALAGVVTEPVAAETPRAGRLAANALWRRARERVLLALLLAGWVSLAGCKRGDAAKVELPVEAGASPPVELRSALAQAEDRRRTQDIPAEAARDHDARIRRLAAKAFARILDTDDAPLLRALADDDAEVAAWGAYGLGESCKGHEDSHVRALAARLVSLGPKGPAHAVETAVRALGRCGGDTAEQTLRAWLRGAGVAGEATAFALGDAAALRGGLSLETAAALLEATQASPPLAAALYPFGRVDGGVSEGLESRFLAAIRATLGRPGPDRIFAVRALGRTGDDEAPRELGRVLSSDAFSPPERAEAARTLGRLHREGQAAMAEALTTLAADRLDAFAGDRFGVLLAALQAVEDEVPKKAEAPLWALARLEPPSGAPPGLARRASAVRCAAAAKLARGVWDADILRGCDVGDGEAGERARVSSLDRGALVRGRRAAWAELARSARPRVREAALEVIGRHPELAEAGRAALAEALASDTPGVVAVAAGVVQAHPERVFVLAESERKAALDPRAPAPSTNPARELDDAVAKGLRLAIAHPWASDLVETRVALLDAAFAAGLPEGGPLAQAACRDPNATVRARAAKALAAAGTKDARCPPTSEPGVAADYGKALGGPVRITLDTDAGPLALRLDAGSAPLAASHIVALARSGFYTGIPVHRVVQGFIVQLGDRGGDGYSGSGETLRCETSPVPFEPLDVGVALAGRDTGSSQIFITLARYPHLDGEYPWVGRAEGDWGAVAEGDVIRAVRVED